MYRRLGRLGLYKIKYATHRNHATYTYSTPRPGPETNPGSGSQEGKSAKSVNDINFNIDRIAASLNADSDNKNEKDRNKKSHQNPQNVNRENTTTETITTVEGLENGNKNSHSIFSKINLPTFTEVDFDYIEVSVNRERCKDWHHEVIKKNELEYFGTFIDSERFLSTHGHWKQPIKSCLLDLIEPSIIANKDQSHVFRVIKMVSFEPEEIVVEVEASESEFEIEKTEPKQQNSETIVSTSKKPNSDDISAAETIETPVTPTPSPKPQTKTPTPQPKIRFQRRKYDTSIPDLDDDAPIYQFKIKEDEEAHRLLTKIRELGNDFSCMCWGCLIPIEEFSPELAKNIRSIYDTAWFGTSLALQTLYLISQGNLFVPEKTCQTSNAWTDDCGFHDLSKNSRTSVEDSFILSPIEVHLQRQNKRDLSKKENFSDSTSEDTVLVDEDVDIDVVSPITVESELEFKEENYEEYVELSETEIVSLVKHQNHYNREEDYYYLVHYQLIHQISKLPGFLTTLGYEDPEYFYHTFVLFNPKTNMIQIIRKGLDDESEVELLNQYLDGGGECEYNYVNSKASKKRYCHKYFSAMMLRPTSENSTCYVSTYSDENSKKLGWESWFQRAALNRGIQHSHNVTNFSSNPTALSGTAIEKLLKFVETNED